MKITRRGLIAGASVAGAAMLSRFSAGSPASEGLFTPDWPSLVGNYRTPDWFRDSKLGFWAHWGAQCIPSAGNWYAREMYIQGTRSSDHHRRIYGHPADKGYLEVLNTWRADRWDPDRLVGLYKDAGARYFVALANHHDNFDNFDSSHHEWNTVRVGPKKDLIGGWSAAAKKYGLRFGVSNHSAHTWHWFQPAYGYDPEGPRRGERYDAHRLTKADGRGTWWDGLDPQALYAGASMPMPAGYASVAMANEWHNRHDRVWTELRPYQNPAFVERWQARCRELVEKYRPDLVYFDNFALPLEQTGLDFTAWYYNLNRTWHDGRLDAVVNAKAVPELCRPGLVEDYERGAPSGIVQQPWQTDTCIGDWFYDDGFYERGAYKSGKTVIHTLADIVAKNGNLLLSIPVRADGSIDDKEERIVRDIGHWMGLNGAAIYGTRPWRVHGEGPTGIGAGQFQEIQVSKAGPQDIRYTQKDGAVNAILLGWPQDGKAKLTMLGRGAPQGAGEVRRVRLARGGGLLPFTRDEGGLSVTLPSATHSDIGVAITVEGPGLTV